MPPEKRATSRPDHNHSASVSSRPSRPRRSSTSTGSRYPSATARHSTQTNFAPSIFSRSSTSTSLVTEHSRANSKVVSSPGTAEDFDISYRDSYISILDDPFFQTYDPAYGPVSDSASSDSDNDSIDAPPARTKDTGIQEPKYPPRRESLIASPTASVFSTPAVAPRRDHPLHYKPPPSREAFPSVSPHHLQQQPNVPMESFNIAVVGAAGAGKSVFIQRLLGLSRPPVSNTSTVRLAVDNVTHIITLLELNVDHLEFEDAQPIQWPKQVNGHIVPHVDAVLTLYNVTDQSTLRELPRVVAAVSSSNLPVVLVACQCDHADDDWDVDPEDVSKHKLFANCTGHFKVASASQEASLKILEAIIRSALVTRKNEALDSVTRKRAQSSAFQFDTPDNASLRSFTEHMRHGRASSEVSIPRGARHGAGHGAAGSTPSDVSHRQTYQGMLRNTGTRIERPSTDAFLDIDGSDTESYRYSDDIPVLQRNDDQSSITSAKGAGLSFDELVDRLLAPRLSKADYNFAEVFQCLYRKFAPPGVLFSAILARLDRVRDDKETHYLCRTAVQMRIIAVIAKWLSLYPGDFARPTTRRNLEEFIRHLSVEPIFSAAALQMRRNLHFNVMEDDDSGWANADDSDDKLGSDILSKEMCELTADINAVSIDPESSRPLSDLSIGDRRPGVASQFQFHNYEEYEREAAKLDPTAQLPMDKLRYHTFMDIPNDDIADELTRLDWVMFSSIRIRDFVRHVSLSAAKKEKCRSLKNINRMINHFNHLAKWVSNMILIREKAKHRAQIMEKFMDIAVKLRQLNNYNALAAVMAGTNALAVHRLAQTRALVSEGMQKRFARLQILMGSQKSHSAYRLAWENSSLPRIPFMPLHLRDLVSAEEGSKTFVGPNADRINWKKFDVLGEVLLPIMKSQGTAYSNLARYDTARGLILGCRMPSDDEEMYQRSISLESGSNTSIAEQSKKKAFPWLAK